MDQDKLADLRRRYADAKGGALYDPEFKRVSQTQFQGERRKWPFTEPATFLAAPHRPNAARRELRRPRRRARRRADGSRRHQPGRRPARAAGGAGRRAHRPLRARAEMRALERRRGSPTSATCRCTAASARKLPCRHREPFRRRSRAAGVRTLAVGGDHSISLRSSRRWARTGRVGMIHIDAHCDTAGAFEGAKFHHGGPFRQAVLDGRARPGAHDPDRHPRRRRISVGVLLRFAG